MMLQRSFLTFGLALSLTAVAWAGEPGATRGPQDKDQDGVISRAEFDAWSSAHFEALDADGDGILQQEELPGARMRQHRERQRGEIGAFVLIRGADVDRNHEVSSEEWQGFRSALEIDGSGAITADSLRAALPGPPRDRGGRRGGGFGPEGGAPRDPAEHLLGALDQNADGVVTLEDIDSIYAGIDLDGDGALTTDEMPEPPHRGHRGGRGGRGDREGRGGQRGF